MTVKQSNRLWSRHWHEQSFCGLENERLDKKYRKPEELSNLKLNHRSFCQCLVDQRPDWDQFQIPIRDRRMQPCFSIPIQSIPIQSIQDINLWSGNRTLEKKGVLVSRERLSHHEEKNNLKIFLLHEGWDKNKQRLRFYVLFLTKTTPRISQSLSLMLYPLNRWLPRSLRVQKLRLGMLW